MGSIDFQLLESNFEVYTLGGVSASKVGTVPNRRSRAHDHR